MLIDRYLLIEIIQTFLAVLLILLLIFMGRYFTVFLADAVAGEIRGGMVIDLLLLRTLSALSMMLPFALYISVLLAFGRLYKDNEMTALASSGVTISRILKSVLAISLGFAIVVTAISLWISPWAEYQRTLITAEAEKTSALEGVLPGQFNQIGSNKNGVFYVEDISEDRKNLTNVFAQIQIDGKFDVFSAKGGYQYRDKNTGDQYLVLVDGFRYQGVPGNQNFTIQNYKKNAIRLVEPNITSHSRRNSTVPTEQLFSDENKKAQAELQWRLSMPIATILLAILGALISRTSPRQGRFAKLFVAIMIYIIYNNVMSIARSGIEQGKLPADIGMWWVHGVLFSFVLYMFYKQSVGQQSYFKLIFGFNKSN